MAAPLCPIVLSMLEVRPRRADQVSRELEARGLGPAGASYAAACETLERLATGRLVRRPTRHGVFALTQRGRHELSLQRSLWRRTMVAG